MKRGLLEAFGSLAGVFRSPDLRRLELAYAASLIGLWAYSIVISVYAFEAGGAALVGVSALLRLLPAAVAAPFAAVLADRYERRLVMLLTDLVRAGLVALVAVSIALDAPVAVPLALAGLIAIVSTAFEPAKNAIVPSLATDPDQLTAANVATSTFESTAIFIGPALGGLLLAGAGYEAALAVTCVLLLCSVAMLTRIGARPAAAAERGEDTEDEGLLTEAFAGIRAVAGDPGLRLVVGLLGAQLVVDGAIGVFVVVIALDVIEVGRGGVGLLDSAAGLGGLVGALLALQLAGRSGLGRAFGIGIAAWGLPLVFIPLLPETAFVLAMCALIGVANTLVDSSGFTLMQRIAPDEVRGRVFGAFETLAIVAVGLGSAVTAGLVEAFGIDAALVAMGAPLALLAAVCWPALRALDGRIVAPEVDLLRGVPMFAGLGAAPLEALASRLERVKVPAGEDVITQGEQGDRFYVIESGEVEVFEDGIFARREGPGEFFGEIALLRDVPRTATVVALTDMELVALDRDPFIRAITGYAPAAEAADAVIGSRLGSVRAGAGTV